MHPHKLHQQYEDAYQKGHKKQSQEMLEQVSIYLLYKGHEYITLIDYPLRNTVAANRLLSQTHSTLIRYREALSSA